jgi:hypothetical protein
MTALESKQLRRTGKPVMRDVSQEKLQMQQEIIQEL